MLMDVLYASSMEAFWADHTLLCCPLLASVALMKIGLARSLVNLIFQSQPALLMQFTPGRKIYILLCPRHIYSASTLNTPFLCT